MGLNYVITQHGSGVELYIDRGQDSEDENMRIFDELRNLREEIERTYGGALEWQPLETKRACRIRQSLDGGYRDPEDDWPEIQERMIRLE